MKLLLTSAGLSNQTIRKCFLDLVGKRPEEISVAFIPTAADPEEDKWFVDSAINEIEEIGMRLKTIDLKDENESSLRAKMSDCDVIYVNGGNTFYLLDWARKSGLSNCINDLLENKVYVGVSAGSILVGPSIEIAGIAGGDKNIVELKDLSGLGLVNFSVFPHYEEKYRNEIEEFASKVNYPVYVLDNNMAVKIFDKSIEIIGEGDGFIASKKK